MQVHVLWCVRGIIKKFLTTNETFVFYIPYEICKHTLISIDFIASVYELFDNPS